MSLARARFAATTNHHNTYVLYRPSGRCLQNIFGVRVSAIWLWYPIHQVQLDKNADTADTGRHRRHASASGHLPDTFPPIILMWCRPHEINLIHCCYACNPYFCYQQANGSMIQANGSIIIPPLRYDIPYGTADAPGTGRDHENE